MFLRAAAIVSALAIPLILLNHAVAGLLAGVPVVGPWIGPALAVLAALPVIIAGREHLTQVIAGAGLAALAAGLSPAVPELLRVSDPTSLTVLDLRSEALPVWHGQRREYLTLRGYLRSEWVIDEYPGGQRPDQNQRPTAVLLPLLGSEDAQVLASDGLVVVARVAPEQLESPPPQTLRGRIGPVSPELVDVLFAVAGAPADRAHPPAVLLDTFDVPTRGQAWTRAALAAGAALLALLLLLTALPRREPAKA